MECEPFIPGGVVSQGSYKIHLSRYVFAAKFVNGANVLDIACGNGYGSSYLLRKGARKVVGGDISKEAIEMARTNFRREGVEFMRLNAANLPFSGNSFNVVVSMGTIDHLDEPERFLLEIQRVLHDGGYFVCSVLNKEFIRPFPFRKPIDMYHKIEFTPPELFQLVSRYFSRVELYGFNYGSKLSIQAVNIASYIIRRKLRGVGMGVARKLLAAALRDRYTPVTYSEDAIDAAFSSHSEYTPLNPKNSCSDVFSFLVVGRKYY